ncbi:MAG: hypothetical protein M1830_007921, partial [Pleopsidium flavum]
MSGKTIILYKSLLRSAGRPSRPQRCFQHACSPLLQQRRNFQCSAPVREEERSFKGQLYESTSQRLQRERAEQARFARERGESSGGRNAAIT